MSLNPFQPRNELIGTDWGRPDWLLDDSRPSDKLWLDKNENVDPILMNELQSIASGMSIDAVMKYPSFSKLYPKLGSYFSLDPKHLSLTRGADGAIRAAFEAFVSSGDVVMLTRPSFAMYPLYCKMFGARVVFVEYEGGSQGPILTKERVIVEIRQNRPRIFFLPNPDSPTGTVFNPEDLRQIAEVCLQTGTILFVDEAYYPFYSKSALPLVSELPHVIVAQTFAKAWGLAGLRIGFCAAPKELAHFIQKRRSMYEVSTIAAWFLDRILDRSTIVDASVKRLLEGKHYFLEEMKDLGFSVIPTHGNFFHIDFGALRETVFQVLDRRITYKKAFSDSCLKGWTRISCATTDQFRPIVAEIKKATTSGR